MAEKSGDDLPMEDSRASVQSCTGYPKKSSEQIRAENTRSRFSDNPFRTGKETPEQLEWLRKRDEATRIFHQTGDKRPAMAIGLFPKSATTHEKRISLERISCDCGRTIRPPDVRVAFDPEKGLIIDSGA